MSKTEFTVDKATSTNSIIDEVKVDSIVVGTNRRQLDFAKVSELAESIEQLGLLNPLTVTVDHKLVAGRHRLEAVKQLSWEYVPCNIVPLDGLSAELAEIDENLVRNDLHPIQQGELTLRRDEILIELGLRAPSHRPNKATDSVGFKTTADLAKEMGISATVLRENKQLARDLIPEAKTVVIERDLSKSDALLLARKSADEQAVIVEKLVSLPVTAKVVDAFREVNRERIVADLEDIKRKEVQAVAGLYDVVVLDPPWPMKKIELDERPCQTVELDYPTMSLEEIAALKLPLAEDCHVFLWTTQKYLPYAFELLEKWGLKYVYAHVWHKSAGMRPFNLPWYNCEFALYARRGTPQFTNNKNFQTCFDAKNGVHSEKPAEFYDMIRGVTAGRRLDMFSRRSIEGFDAWGNEVDGC
ncbi:MT-A70 family methyltransferase [Candidatus Bathycorpusculum sp.]|uniref:Spo0J and IME4 domain-containing protein n=1 Tax=Candidatus Bathycorpusculum sp. TaxID=2994959 RepID=UPI002818E577|nr:MT-A70 family methyltransferase [Candidatus Termitimicrobium sp.]MCL2685945.1 MT-A70 family methyltransferase [Candidatus Termitimicrobium sp.]